MSAEWVDDDDEQKVDLHLWRQLLDYTLHYRKTAVAFTLVALWTAASDVGFPILTGTFIDDVRKNIATNGDHRVHFVWYAVVLTLLTASLCGGIWSFIMCAGKIRTHVSHDIRRDAFRKLQDLSFDFYDRRPVGWLMARLTSDCQRLSNILAWGVVDFIWGTAVMLGATAVMLAYNWKLAIAVLGVVPVLFYVSVFFRKRILQASRKVRKCNSLLTAAYNEGIMGVRTSKVFVRHQQNQAEFGEKAQDMYEQSVHNSILSAIYLPLVLTISSAAIAIALLVGGTQSILGDRSVGEIVMFMYFAVLFFQPIQDLSAWFAELQMAQASAERVLGLVQSVPTVRDLPEVTEKMRLEGISAFPSEIERIEFRNVGFRYETGPQVIHDFSFRVQPGQTVALVGSTGGGKSTLVNLLCRFYEPTTGQILLDGVDYRQYSIAWLQSKLGIVLQQPHLFSGTINYNLSYGNQTATQEEIIAAAKLAGAHDFVASLPNSYENEVGEGGGQLSLGEKQLISFARAILKQPSLLIMDEATSSIDTETEQQIQSAMKRLLEGRTSFVIAHRMSTIRAADVILVIENGRILEQGSHQELLQQKGRYHQLYTEQALGV